MKKIIAALLALLVLGASRGYAGEDKIGEAGFMFLKIPVGARETSMGLNGLTSTTGAAALYWNPANVSAAEGVSVAFSYLNYFAGINSNYFAIAAPIGEVGTFSASLNYLSYGDIEITTVDQPQGTGSSYSPYDMALTFGYSKQITDRVSGGLGVKFLYSKIAEVNASGVAFDFGFTYNTQYRGLKLGFTAVNIGLQSRYQGDGLTVQEVLDTDLGNQVVFWKIGTEPFELPASVNFGLSFDMYRTEQNSVTGVVEENVNNLQANRTNFGVEYGFKDMFFLRGGYSSSFQKNVDFTAGGNGGGYSFGAGVQYKITEKSRVTLDYGYLDMGIFDATHRFSVNIGF